MYYGAISSNKNLYRGLVETDTQQPFATKSEQREWLNNILTAEDPTEGLWEACKSGLAEQIIPELTALELEQDPVHKHKDVLTHTIIVTSRAEPDLTLRLAALLHDIGKPATRRFNSDGVTFRHHEIVGSKIARKRLEKLEYEPDFVDTIVELVRLSGRFKGYSDGWTDSAVRRYVRDAGDYITYLNKLIRADCTTKNAHKEQQLQKSVDELEQRILDLEEEDKRAALRPQLDGNQVMEILEMPAGRVVGQAVKFLTKIKLEEGELDESELIARLKEWYQSQ